MEASLSDGDADSGDELTDDSAGSIADFIDDNDVTRQEDIRAIYLKSVRYVTKVKYFYSNISKIQRSMIRHK